MIIAIDPGTTESAYVIVDEDLRPVNNSRYGQGFGKVKNEVLLTFCYELDDDIIKHFAIEMIASYGMSVGQEVFDTCVWIGRLWEAMSKIPNGKAIYRKKVTMNLCGSAKAGDSNVKQAMVDRFAYGVRNHGKGSKKDPGWFYGFSKDIWSAYAVAVTYHDICLR